MVVPLGQRPWWHDVTELFEDICDALHQPGTPGDKLVTSPAERVIDGMGQREHLPVLLQSQPGGDQGAAPERRLDHQHTQTETADQAVATGETLPLGRRPGRR